MNIIESIIVISLAWQISAMPIPAWIASAFFSVDADSFNEVDGWTENNFTFQNGAWGYLVFSLEFIKGLFAVSVLAMVSEGSILLLGVIPFEYVLAVVVILGHTFPIYNEFNRSKSLGAYFGVFAAIWMVPALIALSVFLILWSVNKKVNFSSLIISLSSMVMVTFIMFDIKAFVIASVLATFLVLFNFQHKVKAVRA